MKASCGICLTNEIRTALLCRCGNKLFCAIYLSLASSVGIVYIIGLRITLPSCVLKSQQSRICVGERVPEFSPALLSRHAQVMEEGCWYVVSPCSIIVASYQVMPTELMQTALDGVEEGGDAARRYTFEGLRPAILFMHVT